ncbi:MAG: hypothetical protein L0Y57_12605 [Beijerinckiaceae bacterium]|nr:hypothetical protein [Beijerinckiaceae bacterium]
MTRHGAKPCSNLKRVITFFTNENRKLSLLFQDSAAFLPQTGEIIGVTGEPNTGGEVPCVPQCTNGPAAALTTKRGGLVFLAATARRPDLADCGIPGAVLASKSATVAHPDA